MIGMLGGMGPESTAYTYMRMIRCCQQEYGAKLDSDFPPILVYSVPVPDVVNKGSNDAEVFEELRKGVKKLSDAGAGFSFIACNTMQGFIPELRKTAPMLSIVEETVKAAGETGISSWGILATETTIGKGFYQKAFSETGLSVIKPDAESQAKVTSAIRDILAGGRNSPAKEKLLQAVEILRKNGAEGIILACTDLPIVISGKDTGMKTIDTADVIARAAVERYMKKGDMNE
ncbi:amino acid racemase [Candidatus Micrarchaeota archaeon]|nr:amino acid racemase [Candidatus Micrarchaeota archaeon]